MFHLSSWCYENAGTKPKVWLILSERIFNIDILQDNIIMNALLFTDGFFRLWITVIRKTVIPKTKLRRCKWNQDETVDTKCMPATSAMAINAMNSTWCIIFLAISYFNHKSSTLAGLSWHMHN